MDKRIKIGLSLLLCFVVGIFYVSVSAESGRESKDLPPQQIEQMYSSETWAIRGQNSSEVTRFRVDFDGSFHQYDSSGVLQYGVTNAGAFSTGTRKDIVTLAFAAGVGYTVTNPVAGDIFLIPSASTDEPYEGIASSGVTVVIPAPSASNLGWTPTIILVSGTSPLVLYIDGTKTIGTSGATNLISSYDAEGDSVTLGYLEAAGTGVSVYVLADTIDGT